MWSSRKGLILQNLAILGVIILIRLEPRPKPIGDNREPAENRLFLDTIRNALDAVYYLQDMERGRAHVAPVVEEPKAVVMRRPCQNHVERVFNEEGWIRNGPWHLFSAYADLRNNSLYPGKASVQIIASTYDTPMSASHKWYCHFASPNSTLKFTVEAHLRLIWQRGWDPRGDFYNPYLITCGLPSDHYRDAVLANDYYVAIDQRRCIRSPSVDYVKITRPPGNTFRAPSHPPKVAVCVKGMDFTDDRTQPFVEWLELQYLLGADAVAVYVYYVPPKLRDALKYYEKAGRLRVAPE
ncbi:Protein Y47D3B.4 [Aphelenchoides avenae]|nr:Protein Y47D3B.4 [Aphelenchus avenae]